MNRRDFINCSSCFLLGCLTTSIFNRYINTKNNFYENHDYTKNVNMQLNGFTVAVSSHCNLNCKGCDTYSPLAKQEFVTYNQFTEDMQKLKELAPDRMFSVGLLGGEPLLNPDFTKIIKKHHELFPYGSRGILTNGILLNNMNDDFWNTLKNTQTGISISKYPINIDRSIYEKKAKKFDIHIEYSDIRSDKFYDIKTHEVISHNYHSDGAEWSKNILDLDGKQDYVEKRYTCPHRGIVQYARGNIYYCYVHAFINAFIDYFKVNIPITNDDYIKIADVKSIEEIDEFLSTPKPLCKYCKQCHNTCYGSEPLEWGFSERQITEWT